MKRLVVALGLAASACADGPVLLFRLDAGATDGGAAVVLEQGQLASGRAFTCAIRSGDLWCWGSNGDGQLGLGDLTDRTRPALLVERGGWLSVTGGTRHACALRAGGDVWCWGANDEGQLGLRDSAGELFPTRVELPEPAVQVATRFTHTCAIVLSGDLYCWGDNSENNLGLGLDVTLEPRRTPLHVGTEKWSSVGTGDGHTCAVRDDGTLWCWGRNTSSECGRGVGAPIRLRVPQPVMSDRTWASVAAGQSSTCGLDTTGKVWCWGARLGVQGEVLVEPTEVGVTGATSIDLNTFAGVALAQGHVTTWGRNVEGQLGDGTLVDSLTAVTPTLPDVPWVEVAASRFSTCAAAHDGAVWCTGQNTNGELGVGDVVRRQTFVPVTF